MRTVSWAALLAAAGALGACTTSLPDFTQFKLPSTRSFLPQNMDTYVPPTSAEALRTVTPADLVDAQGMCAGMAPAVPDMTQVSDAGGAPPAAAPAGPPMLGSVGLNMTECEVVHAIGRPQSVQIGAGERGSRQVIMIYMGNERAGTYEFVDGRLTALERGPEPPPPPKPEKKKPKKKAGPVKRTAPPKPAAS